MDIISVLSRLLDYPNDSLHEHEQEILQIIADADIKSSLKDKTQAFVRQRFQEKLLDWQSDYDGLFERGRSLGLWLFEHVHGESRDRGQAMVDLMAQYREANLEISQHELPDFIPLFLEFTATQGAENVKSWLGDVEHIFALLQVRLENRDSDYSVLFEVLLDICDAEVDIEAIRETCGKDKPDHTSEALDKEWEEEEVTFGAESLEKSCDKAKRKPSEKQRKDIDIPLHWVGFENDGEAAPTKKTSERNS